VSRKAKKNEREQGLEGSRFNTFLNCSRHFALSRVAAEKRASRRLPRITQRDEFTWAFVFRGQ
jgi:hypothetical protein